MHERSKAVNRRSGVVAIGLGVLCLSASVSAGSTQEQLEADIAAPDYHAPHETLRRYIGEALENNPSIDESLARYRAALEKIPQVDALPDPMFGFVQAIRSVETRVGPQNNALTLSQRFPWFGKLDLRGKVALQAALAMHQTYRARQREVIARTKRAYYELAYIDAAIGISREEQSLLEHYEELAETRYATGQGLQQAVIKIQAEITRVLNRLDILEQQRVSVEASLNTLMDRPPEASLPAVGQPAVPNVDTDLQALYELGLENRQELLATERRIERSERTIDLAKKNYWPDFFVGVGFMNVGDRSDPPGIAVPPLDNGKNALSISAGISLPIYRDKYDAAVREAGESLHAERSRYASVRNEMEFSIRDEVVRIQTLSDQIRLFERALIPQSEEALSSTESAYETGQLGVLDLLDSERVLLNVRLANARYHSDLLIALARLERAIGTRFPR